MQILPFDDRKGLIWFNGDYIEWSNAKVHVLNHGLHYGSCVFEGLRIYEGQIFKLNEHIQRLYKSASILDLEIPYNEKVIIDVCKKITQKQNVKNGYIRPVVWRGSEMMAISALEASTNLAIACWEWPSYFSPEKLLKGIKLTVSKWKRPSPESAPTDSKAAGLYMICSLSKHKAEQAGFDDALMLDYRGYIAEATGANIFFVKDKEIFTPKPDCFLNGITRQAVIEMASKQSFKITERHILPEEIINFDEAFLTGTAAEITPIRSIDEFNFNTGDNTTTFKFMSDFSKMVNDFN